MPTSKPMIPSVLGHRPKDLHWIYILFLLYFDLMTMPGKVLISAAVLAAALVTLPVRAAELVMFEQQFCEWCEAWDEAIGVVYDKTDEGQRAPLRRVDIFDPRPADLTHIRGVVYTPTFVLIDGGKEIGRITGYPGEDFFWPLLDDLIERLNNST